MPPLSQRPLDIMPAVKFFIQCGDDAPRRFGNGSESVLKKVAELLRSFPWPGNLRQLQDTVAACRSIKSETGLDEEKLEARIHELIHRETNTLMQKYRKHETKLAKNGNGLCEGIEGIQDLSRSIHEMTGQCIANYKPTLRFELTWKRFQNVNSDYYWNRVCHRCNNDIQKICEMTGACKKTVCKHAKERGLTLKEVEKKKPTIKDGPSKTKDLSLPKYNDDEAKEGNRQNSIPYHLPWEQFGQTIKLRYWGEVSRKYTTENTADQLRLAALHANVDVETVRKLLNDDSVAE